MKRFFAFLVFALSLSQSPAFAADDNVDPMALAAANDLLVAMRYKHTLAAEMKAASDKAPDTLRQIVTRKVSGNQMLTAEARAKMVATIDKKLPAAEEALEKLFTDPATTDAITAETARLYTRYFTIEDMRQTAAFYRTPAGSKLLALAPRVTAESLTFGQAYIAPRMDKLIEELMAAPLK
jgi:hypothetical protein